MSICLTECEFCRVKSCFWHEIAVEQREKNHPINRLRAPEVDCILRKETKILDKKTTKNTTKNNTDKILGIHY